MSNLFLGGSVFNGNRNDHPVGVDIHDKAGTSSTRFSLSKDHNYNACLVDLHALATAATPYYDLVLPCQRSLSV